MSGREVTTREVREMERLYRAGLSTPRIARHLGRSYKTVYRHLSGRGLLSIYRLPDDELRRTVTLYRSGYTLARIAATLGIGERTVRDRLVRAGEPLRSRAEVIQLITTTQLLRHGGLTRRAAILRYVRTHPGVNTGQVQRRFELTKPTALRHLRKLEAAGKVTASGTGWLRWHVVTDPAAPEPEPEPERGGKVPEHERLPIEPFREWLQAQLDHDRATREPDDGRTTFAERVGLSDRRLYALMHEQQTIALATADRILLAAGDTFLWDVWPHLYAPEAAEVAA